jgi:hypothetical protein
MNQTEGMQKQLYGIGIFEEEIVLSDFTGGAEKRFVVTPEQLMAFVSSEITFRPFPGLLWMKSGANQESFLLVLPPAPRILLYRKSKKLSSIHMSLPAIAVEARIDKTLRKVSSIDMWGLAKKNIQADSVLYELPLPNLSGSSLCLGSTERTAGGDVRAAVEKTIFETPFNHHNHLVGLEKIPFHDYVKKYKGNCPLNTLKLIGKGRDILK